MCVCVCAAFRRRAKPRDIYMSMAQERRGQKMSRDSSSSIHTGTSHDPPPPHAPAVPIHSPPASPGTEAHASLAALVSGCRRAGNPCPLASGTLWPYPLKRHSFGRLQNFFFPCSCWLGRRRSKSEPLRSSHLRLATRRATLRSEADKHFFFFFFCVSFCLFSFNHASRGRSYLLRSPPLSTRQKAVHIDQQAPSIPRYRCSACSQLRAPCRHQHPRP